MEISLRNNDALYNNDGQEVITYFPNDLEVLTIDGLYKYKLSKYHLFDFLPESLKELRIINCEISQKFIDNLPISLKKYLSVNLFSLNLKSIFRNKSKNYI